MMKSQFLTVLLVMLIAAACSNRDEIGQLQKSLDMEAAKVKLLTAGVNDIPIKKIKVDEFSTTLYFEDNTSTLLSNSYLQKIDKDQTTWKATFYFGDGTNVTCPMLGVWSIDSSRFQINPYGHSPLAAIADFTAPIKSRIAVVVRGRGTNGIPISHQFETFETHHIIPILGLYADYNNQVDLMLLSKDGIPRDTITVYLRTQSLPTALSVQTDTRTSYTDQGLYFNAYLPLGFDQNGDIRWYYSGEFLAQYARLSNGNMIITSPVGQSGSNVKTFFEVTLLGQVLHRYDVPNFQHHEIIELPNRNLLVASNGDHKKNGVNVVEDIVVELDRNSGKVVNTIDLTSVLDPDRVTLPDAASNDWLHINSLYYDTRDNGLVVSGRSQCAVFKVDYPSGQLRWILAPPVGWNEALSPYLLKPASDIKEGATAVDFWPYGQHSARILANGDLLLYDDGDYRDYYFNNSVPAKSYTRLVQYAINESERTIRIAWQFDHNKEIFTQFTGYTDLLPNGNYFAAYMFGPGPNTPRITEVDASGIIQYEARMTGLQPTYYRTYKSEIYQHISEGVINN
jgi:arylsulfate sulfotransferase